MDLRTQRQTESLKKWITSKCIGSIIGTTGFGKTRLGLRAIKWLLKNNPEAKVLIVVPTDYLKKQWISLLTEWKLIGNCEVWIINSVITRNFACDFLIIDEVHVSASETFANIFKCVKYKIGLGLTGTIDRLDGKEEIIKRYLPVCDEITLDECIKNKWLAEHRIYKVLVDVDLSTYQVLNQQFIQYFSFFNFDFNLAMSMLGNAITRRTYAKQNNIDYKVVDANAFGFNRALQGRKQFILNHPYKIELTNKIINNRPNSKGITFSQSIEMASSITYGEVIHSKLTKKKRKEIEDRFNASDTGILNSVKAYQVGCDFAKLNLAIFTGGNSSKIDKHQATGRILRKEGDKVSEAFNLVLRGTVEEDWANRSMKNLSIITIDEKQLLTVLKGEELKEKNHNENNFLFRW